MILKAIEQEIEPAMIIDLRMQSKESIIIRSVLLFILTLFFIEPTQSQSIIFKRQSNITEHEIGSVLSVYTSQMLRMVKTITVEPLEGNVVGKAGFNWISLSTNCREESLSRTIHHELSSVFLQQPDFFKTFNKIGYQFINLNGDSASYYNKGEGYVDLPIVDLTEREKEYFAGNSYAKSSFQNDYNMICEELFVNGRNFIGLIESKPESVIYKKVIIVIDYYHSLDSKFTIDFFRTR